MDDRRLELGLRWRDVAEAGGVSYEALRDVRNGTGGIRRLTEHAIEVGLQWTAGSVQGILAGRDPLPTGSEPVPAPAVDTATAADSATAADVTDAADDVTGAVLVALFGAKERKIWAQVRRRLAATEVGRTLFSDPAEVAAWPAESADGTRGGAPFDLSERAREVLKVNVTPGSVLFDRTPEVVVWNLDTLPFRKRVEMIREFREPVRGAGTARRAGLKEPDGLSA